MDARVGAERTATAEQLAATAAEVAEVARAARAKIAEVGGDPAPALEALHERLFATYKDFASAHPVVVRYAEMGRYEPRAFAAYIREYAALVGRSPHGMPTRADFLAVQAEYPAALAYFDAPRGATNAERRAARTAERARVAAALTEEDAVVREAEARLKAETDAARAAADADRRAVLARLVEQLKK